MQLNCHTLFMIPDLLIKKEFKMVQLTKALFLQIQELSYRVMSFGRHVKNRKPSHINFKTVAFI